MMATVINEAYGHGQGSEEEEEVVYEEISI